MEEVFGMFDDVGSIWVVADAWELAWFPRRVFVWSKYPV
jgi:hypothetical protein